MKDDSDWLAGERRRFVAQHGRDVGPEDIEAAEQMVTNVDLQIWAWELKQT